MLVSVFFAYEVGLYFVCQVPNSLSSFLFFCACLLASHRSLSRPNECTFAHKQRKLGWWVPSSVHEHPDILATLFPWVSSIALSLQVSCAILVMMSLSLSVAHDALLLSNQRLAPGRSAASAPYLCLLRLSSAAASTGVASLWR
jgi:hypothetical protein